jgi:hypothetical protein
MNDPIDIIEGINSLDDVLSSTAGALNAVAGHMDDLRKAAATSPKAAYLLECISQEIDALLHQANVLRANPEDNAARTHCAKTANQMHTYGEDALILLSELES